MDCSMPIMDGFEATEQIRASLRQANQPQPLIIACTGHTEPEYIKKAWAYSMDEVLAKPANIEIVRLILNEIFMLEPPDCSRRVNS